MTLQLLLQMTLNTPGLSEYLNSELNEHVVELSLALSLTRDSAAHSEFISVQRSTQHPVKD